MKLRLPIVVVMLFLLILILPFFVTQVESGTSTNTLYAHVEGATIWTDKGDYSPEETVAIFGSGFLASKQVAITITAPDSSVATIYATTDGSGAFTAYYTLDGMEGTYTVAATDGTNTATTTFTDTTYRYFTATISPTTAITGETKSYTITITNDMSSSSGVLLGSATIAVPSGFTIVSSLSVSYPSGKLWTATLVSSYINLNATADSNRLSRGQSVSVTFSATAPGTAGTYTWTTTAWTDRSCGYKFTLKGTQPKVTVSTAPTVSITITSSPVTGSGFVKVDGTAYDTPHTFTWTVGGTHTLQALSPVSEGTGTQYVYTSWSDGGTQTHTYTVPSTSETVTANYQTQYYLTVQSDHGTTSGEGWYNKDDFAYAGVSPLTVPGDEGVQYVFTYWSVDASGTTSPSDPIKMDGPKTAVANWKTQYYLIVNTNPAEVLSLNPAAVSGQGWYDSGFTATVDAVQNIDKVAGESRYDFRSWTGATPTGVGNQATVLMDGPKTATANYQLQYNITFAQSGVGSDFTGTVVIIDSTNYGRDSVSFWWDSGSSHTFAFQSPLVVTPNGKQYVWISTTGLSTLQSDSITVSSSGSVTGNYKTQYYLSVSSPSGYGSPNPTSGWFDAGSSITASVTSPWSGPTGTRYVCTGWAGTGSVPPSGTGSSVTFTLIESSSITWNWVTQYYLTVRTDPSGLVTIPGEGWYNSSKSVSLSAPSVAGYTFLNWDVDSVSQGSGVSTISVSMNAPHTATAHYAIAPPPLSVSISPPSASIRVGQSTAFTSSVSGGTTPYSYQWYLNGNPVSGATSSSWTFSPTAPGTYSVYLEVTDKNGNIAQSAPATVNVSPAGAVPVGGYSISLVKQTPVSSMTMYAMLIVLFGAALSLTKRKRK